MTDVFIGEYSLAGVLLESVQPPAVEDDGGYELTLRGLFKDEEATVVLIDSDLNEFVCYSAKRGQRYRPRPRTPTTMIVATPPLPPGVYAVRVAQSLDDDELSAAVTVFRRNWKSKTYDYRRLFPPWYAMGPRHLDRIDLLETDLDAGAYIDLSAITGEPFSFQLSSNNPRGVTLTWTNIGVALPGWLTLAPSGLLSGTPSAGDVGTLSGLKFRVNDGVQTADTNVFALDVASPSGGELLTESLEALLTEDGENLILDEGA